MTVPSYRQPEKQAVRQRILTEAVSTLTSNRHLAPIALRDEVRQTLTFALGVLNDRRIATAAEDEYAQWVDFYTTSVGSRAPSALKVLYLCGPEPLNDLHVLLDNGISPYNVWAIESGHREFSSALQELQQSGIPVKLHRGSVAAFFDSYPATFDIIYIDACGPFLSGKPNTLEPILRALVGDRLAPLAVLITNFAEPPSNSLDRFADLITAFFRFRYRDLPPTFWNSNLDPAICAIESGEMREFVRTHLEPFYSDFITRLIVDLARFYIPNCRALASRDVSSKYLVTRRDQKRALRTALRVPNDVMSIEDWIEQAGHVVLSPNSYPILSFFREITRQDDALAHQIGNLKLGGRELRHILPLASLMDRVFEGHWKCLSKEFLTAVALSWFDVAAPYTCDSPLPNLLINSLLGVHGHPLLANPRRSVRLKYRATTTTMYTDCLLLDKCRYYFDWFPSIDLVPHRFKSPGFQVVARSILDRLGRTDWSSESHPFRGAAVTGFGEIPAAKKFDFSAREVVTDPTVN